MFHFYAEHNAMQVISGAFQSFMHLVKHRRTEDVMIKWCYSHIHPPGFPILSSHFNLEDLLITCLALHCFKKTMKAVSWTGSFQNCECLYYSNEQARLVSLLISLKLKGNETLWDSVFNSGTAPKHVNHLAGMRYTRVVYLKPN